MGTQSGGFDVNTGGKDVQERETEGAWLEMSDANGEPEFYTDAQGEKKPIRIKVAGSYSKQYRLTGERQRERLVKARKSSVTGAQLTDNQRELAAACTLTWEGFYAGEQVFECTKPNAIALYTQAPWYQEQVEEQMGDHASFFKKPSTS